MDNKNIETEHHSSGEWVEPDRTPAKTLLASLVILSIGLVVVIAALLEGYKVFTQEELYIKVGSVENRALKERLAVDHKRLTTYDKLEEQGKFQLPIDQAMEKLLRKPELLRGVSGR